LSRSGRLDNSERYLSMFSQAWNGHMNPLTCHVGAGHVVFDAFGKINACMPFNEKDKSWGNLHSHTLKELWDSPAHHQVIRETSACHECFWNCHTEMNLMFDRSRKNS